jgi:hypothetical protein
MRPLSSLLAALGWLVCITPLAPGEWYVELGDADPMAPDQPRVAVEVYDPGPPEESFGPDIYNTFALDTGANSVLAGYLATSYFTAGYQVEPGVQYVEQGLVSSVSLDVSLQYNFDFAGTDGQRNTLSDVRILSTENEAITLGGWGGIAGMPAMAGRVTSVDNTPMGADFPELMGVDFPDAPPPGAGHRYTMPLTLVEFEQSGQQNPDDPLPVWAPLPFVGAELHHDGGSVSDSFLVDTGAPYSFISSDLAFALGLDANGDGNFDEESVEDRLVGGLSGEFTTAPVLLVDRLDLPTNEGIDLRLANVPLVVVDVDESIPGILGVDVLTCGWYDDVLFGATDGGAVEQFHFDFRSADALVGEMILDLNPDVDVVMPEPASAAMLLFGAVALLKRRGRRARPR